MNICELNWHHFTVVYISFWKWNFQFDFILRPNQNLVFSNFPYLRTSLYEFKFCIANSVFKETICTCVRWRQAIEKLPVFYTLLLQSCYCYFNSDVNSGAFFIEVVSNLNTHVTWVYNLMIEVVNNLKTLATRVH